MEVQAKTKLNKKAHSAVILCLGNKVLREVTGKTTATGISELIDDFNKLVLDLSNIEVKFKDEDLALLLLTSLPSSYEHFLDTLLYGWEALTLEDVVTLNSKKIKKRSKAKGDDGDDSDERTNSARLDHGFRMFIPHEPMLDILFDFLKCDGASVQLGDNRECKIRGLGIVRIQLRDGSSFVLHNVRYIPELKRNLISLGTLEKERFTIKLQSGKVKVINGSRVVLSGIRRDNCVYYLDGHAMAGELIASVEEKDSLAQGVIDYVHSDLRGPSQVESLGGKRYFLSIVDDYSKRTGRTVKKLRTDNGLEFYNQEFEQLCIESEIARHLTVFGTPQQNGPAQRKIDSRAIKCVLSGYREGVKGYKLYRLDDESPKIITSSNVVFNESVMYKDTLKDFGVGADKSIEELHVEVELQRERRTRTKPLRFRDESNMAAYTFVAAKEEDTHKPLTYQEVVSYKDSSKWKAAMKEEMDSLRKNKTWELVDHPVGQKLMSCKWMFKIKEGMVFKSLDGILHENLEEVIYMRKPSGYEQGNKVCLLKKFLYGLKQSPRQWYKRFDEYMLSNRFKRSSYDSCVYYRSYAPGEYISLLLYVDDMMIACESKAEIENTKTLLKKEFDMKELGEAKKILGMEIIRDRSRKILRVSQSGYISKILNNFRIENGKSVKMPLGGHFKLLLKDCPVRDCDVERMSKASYANAVGSLMYLMVCTRPDIAYVDPDKGRFITRYAFLVPGYVVSWKATLQHVVALSTIEAEYMALTKAVNEAIWLKELLKELGVVLNTVTVNCDNLGVVHLSRNHVFHERT
nr:retrotransposon protein, putative, Ty1-copia subclass [Tanacetum cinerariifolium]